MNYDLQTQTLIKEIKRLDESLDKEILPKLALLEKRASAMQDDFLLGFTYYYYSFASYYFDPKREQFTDYLSRAVHYLIRVEDHEMLARVYNLIAIDAFSYGSYDIAYSYYMQALEEAAVNQSDVFLAVIETNLSLLFLELRDFKQAKERIKKAVRLIEKHASEDVKFFSLHAAYVDEAAIRLELEEYQSAKQALKKAIRVLPKANAPDEDLSLSLAMLKFRLAEIDGDREEKKKRLDQLSSLLTAEEQPEGYFSDIRNLCMFLLQRKEIAAAKRIVDAVDQKMYRSDRVHIVRAFSTLKADLAKMRGDRKALDACLREQHAYLKTHRIDIARVHRYLLRLVELNERIRNMQAQARAEQQRLQEKASHDALTKLANRRMLNVF